MKQYILSFYGDNVALKVWKIFQDAGYWCLFESKPDTGFTLYVCIKINR